MRHRLLPTPGTPMGHLAEWVILIALVVGLVFGIQAWVVKPYRIPSQSMEPTLDIGQRIFVNRFIYHFTDPSIGDIVVFHPPAGAEEGQQCGRPAGPREACPEAVPQESSETFVKRIVAGPGDTLSVKDGHPVVNGVEKTDEPYIHSCNGGSCDLPKTITIPAGRYFMMGDNRGESNDSRFWGPVPRGWIIGEAFATYWPPDRIGLF